jgi:cytochrome c
MRAGVLLAGAAMIVGLGGCGREPAWQAEAAGGDARRGAMALREYGCIACHEIRGVPGANGRVGPSLSSLRDRTYIAGALPNDPETLILWIMNPTAYRNPTAMPELGVTEADARDIVTYLYSLR